MRGNVTWIARVWLFGSVVLAGIVVHPVTAAPVIVGNAACHGEEVFFDPGNGEDIIVREGYRVEVFAKGLNFRRQSPSPRTKNQFRVFVLESGRGLPSRCNDNEDSAFGGKFSATNPLTPDILVFDQNGHQLAGPLGKLTPEGAAFNRMVPPLASASNTGLREAASLRPTPTRA
jgi:hypothetical protein